MSITWADIYSTNWHKLSVTDVESWQWQIQNVLPDLQQGEILAAMNELAAKPDMDGRRQSPRPRDVVNQIRAIRARSAKPTQQHGEGDSVPYYERLQDVLHLAESGDWYGIAEYCAQPSPDHPTGRISSDIVNQLWADIQCRYPRAVYCWPDENCATYEWLHNEPCPYWGPGRVHIKRDISKLGPLAHVVGDLP